MMVAGAPLLYAPRARRPTSVRTTSSPRPELILSQPPNSSRKLEKVAVRNSTTMPQAMRSIGLADTMQFRMSKQVGAWLRHGTQRPLETDRQPPPLTPRAPAQMLKDTVRVGLSGIHGTGIFAVRPLKPGDMIIEYAGETIRPCLTVSRGGDGGRGCSAAPL